MSRKVTRSTSPQGEERDAAPAVASQGARRAGMRKATRPHWNSAARPRAGRPRAANAPGKSLDPKPRALDDSQLLADCIEGLEGAVELGFAVGAGDYGSDPGAPFGHGRVADSLGEDAGLKEAVREVHGGLPRAHDHRRDRRLAGPGLEARPAQAVLEP